MKKHLLFVFLLLSVIGYTQNGINYKALIKDDLGNVLANTSVDIKFIILEGDAQTNIYEETHSPTTDNNGIIIINIGEGTIINGIFDDINWENDDHFLNVKINSGSGFINLGTIQFSTVPYALHAKKATNVKGLEPIDEGNGMGWRLVDRNPTNYDNIGFNAIDFSFVDDPTLGLGATGSYAFSLGHNGTASGEHALAFGNQNYSLNDYAIALGNNNTVSGLNSTAIGAINQVSGDYAFAVGLQNEASQNHTIALGTNVTASGEYAIAMGQNTIASGFYSISMGRDTQASGFYSTSTGRLTLASGNYSTAMGQETEASGDNSAAMGRKTEASGTSSTAMGSMTEASGTSSTAMGFLTVASSSSSTAMGIQTLASGSASTAMGQETQASGDYSMAIGLESIASGINSTSIGSSTQALGDYSIAMGSNTIASVYASTAIGSYNVGGGTSFNWFGSDPLFEIGNSHSGSPRSNALTVLKNGNIGIGTHTPQELLHISGGRLRIGTETIEDTGSNQLSFGASLIPDANNAYRLGNSSNRWIGVWAIDGTINTSDRRSKTNIASLNYGLEDIMKLKPVSFNWKANPNDDTKLGLIAQDLLKVIPEVVKTHEWETDEDDNKVKKELERMGVYYSDLVPVLINAIKEQQECIKSLQSRVFSQQSKIKNQDKESTEQTKVLEALLSRVDALEHIRNQ